MGAAVVVGTLQSAMVAGGSGLGVVVGVGLWKRGIGGRCESRRSVLVTSVMTLQRR